MAQWNKLFRSLLRPGDVPLRRHRRGCGNRPRSWLAAHRLQVMLLLLFFCKEVELSVGVVVAAWPDLAPPRWRWSSAASSDSGVGEVGATLRSMGDRRRLHPVFHDGCLLRLQQSQRAMGLLQLKVRFGSFFGGDGRRRGGRPLVDLEGSRGVDVFLLFFWVLHVVWLEQVSSYPVGTCLYSYVFVYAFP